MLQNPAKKTLFQKQIPTIIGLLVLVVALVAAVFTVGDGPGVFAPRATPQTTPKQIKVTNVTDSGFTISFLTDEATAGFVKYGETAGELQSQSSDDRDQLSGSIGQYQTHHVTVRGLKPATQYFYTLGTGTRASFDNNGQPFEITTAKRAGAPSAAKTAYGSVVTAAGAPADGALVYVAIQGVGEMSSLVKSSGSYAIALSNARTADGSSYAQIADTDTMGVTVQGPSASQVSSFSVTVADSQPIATVTLGQAPDLAATTTSTDPGLSRDSTTAGSGNSTATNSASTQSTATQSANTNGNGTGGSDILSEFGQSRSQASTSGASLASTTSNNAAATSSAVVSASDSARVINLESTTEQTVTTGDPILVGKAAPGVTISITVNSETQIQQQLIADGNGNFVLDIEKLKEQLEPGEHTATYSYTDPKTGELVTKTVTFTVEAPAAAQSSTTSGTGGTSNQLAQARAASPSPSPSASPKVSPSPTPFGSGNPVSLNATASATASGSKGSTRSALPATTSAIPVSGSVGTTLTLLVGGFFFITAGVWSFWAAREYDRGLVESEQIDAE